MSEPQKPRETAVEQVRRIRDQLNRQFEGTSGKALLDQIHGHRYENPRLRRLAMKAAMKTESPEPA